MIGRFVAVLTVLLLYAGTAWAEDPAPEPPAPPTDETQPAPLVEQVPQVLYRQAPSLQADAAVRGGTTGSHRSTGEEFMVLPSGMDVGARLRTITADGGLGTEPLKLTDVALFDLAAQWAIAKHYELDASVTMLPKQPSATNEHIFQGGTLALRRDATKRTAIALAGSGTPLLGIKGMAFGGSLFLEYKQRLNEIVTFGLAGGASATYLRPTSMEDHPLIVEGAGRGSVLARVPNGVWGCWFGVGYAVPAYRRGLDPVSGMAIDPQPRLDLSLGTAVQLAEKWDLSVDLSIIDRGDLADPATRLPILDGGFDQVQFMVGVSRRLDLSSTSKRDGGSTDPLIMP